jgi:putative two-component system response regulator
MREYCRLLSQQLARMPAFAGEIDAHFIETIYAASPLHDIGKVGVPDHILLKPGALDAREWNLMRTHTVIGAETLRAVYQQYGPNDFVRMGIDIAESHHEKWDGSGYPAGLAGEDIPLAARILALGDVYDALTSRRCYKRAFAHCESRALIVEASGKHFDPRVVEAFLAVEEEFIRIRRHYQDPDDRA